MTNQPVLRARTTPATAPVPASEADAQFDVQLRRARAIADAKQAVPSSYRTNPGAVLLAMDWAQSRGMDLLTAIQTVAFIDGKPVIDATMQRALADRAGYRVSIPDASPTSATVQIADADGEVLGSATYSIDDAKRAGLANKKNWTNNPEDMLVARATTRAMRRFAPSVMVGLVAGEDELDEIAPDPIAVLDSNAGEEGDPQTVVMAGKPAGETEEPSAAPSEAAPTSSPDTSDDDIAVAEVVDGPITDATREAVAKAIGEAKASGQFKERGMALQEAGIPPVAKQMTEAEGVRALAILTGGAE